MKNKIHSVIDPRIVSILNINHCQMATSKRECVIESDRFTLTLTLPQFRRVAFFVRNSFHWDEQLFTMVNKQISAFPISYLVFFYRLWDFPCRP